MNEELIVLLEGNLTSLIQSMAWYGGDFDKALGKLLGIADDINRRKIYETWPEIMTKHLNMRRQVQDNERAAYSIGKLMEFWAYRVNDVDNVKEFVDKYLDLDKLPGEIVVDSDYLAGVYDEFYSIYDNAGFAVIDDEFSTTGETVALFLDRITGEPVRY